MSLNNIECLIPENKYPKSKHNFKCIGPCYQPNTVIVHPLTLEYVTDKYSPFCPVNEWNYVNENGENITKTTDICYHPTKSKDSSGLEFGMNILTPDIDFNDQQFLKIVYNIYSFEDAINWVNTRKYTTPLLTRERIMNATWNSYPNDLNVIDYRLVEFYIELAKRKWMSDIYKKFNKYVHINNSVILLGDPNTNDLNPNDDVIIRTNFLADRFINNVEMYKFLTKFLKHKKGFNDENIKTNLIKYIGNKIKLTIGKK